MVRTNRYRDEDPSSIGSSEVRDFASVYSDLDSFMPTEADYDTAASPTRSQRKSPVKSISGTYKSSRKSVAPKRQSHQSRDDDYLNDVSVAESFASAQTPSVQSFEPSVRQTRKQPSRSVAPSHSKVSQARDRTASHNRRGASGEFSAVGSVATPSVVEDEYSEQSSYYDQDFDAEVIPEDEVRDGGDARNYNGRYKDAGGNDYGHSHDQHYQDDEKLMEMSDIDTVVNSVMRSLANQRKKGGSSQAGSQDLIASVVSKESFRQEPSLMTEDYKSGYGGNPVTHYNDYQQEYEQQQSFMSEVMQDEYGNDSAYDRDYERFVDGYSTNQMSVADKQASRTAELSRIMMSLEDDRMSIPAQISEPSPSPLPPSGRQRRRPPRAPTKAAPVMHNPLQQRDPHAFHPKPTPIRDTITEVPQDYDLAESSEDESVVEEQRSFGAPFQDGLEYDDGLIAYDTAPKAVKSAKGASREDLQLRKRADDMLSRRQFRDLISFLQMSPNIIGIRDGQQHGRNLLHLIAIQQRPVPENVILKIISHDVSAVSAADSQGNTPLHYASLNARNSNIHVFLLFQKFNPLGSLDRNREGDLPLHLAAANPHKGAEKVVSILLESNSKAVAEPNNKGKIPLHFALTVGSSNLKTLKTILYVHKARHLTVAVKDNRGNTPLHTAIMSGTSYDAIELFNTIVRETELSAYTKENDQRYLPLHLALMMKFVNPFVVLSLIKAAPFAAGVPTPSGDMPICLATKQNMEPDIIKGLLAADLPFELGSKKGNSSMGALVEREHGHSWWHAVVEHESKYVDVVTSLLADFATFTQIVALARSTGPNGKKTMEAATRPMKEAIRNLLRFYYRFEITTSKIPITTNEMQSFPGIDHGEELEKMKVKGPWLRNGFTEILEDELQREAKDCGREIEYVPWDSARQQVTLRCYAHEEDFYGETKIRERFNLSSKYVEEIYSVHHSSNYVNASFTSGKLLCIAFERNEVTLGELMNDPEALASRSRLKEIQSMLRDVATSLDHLHNKCLSHGCLDLNAVARFRSGWKLLDIGSATAMGDVMRGSLRRCAPPEVLSDVQKKTAAATDNKVPRGRARSRSRSRLFARSRSKSKTKGAPSGKGMILPPKATKLTEDRKKFGIFMFGMKDLGLGSYGTRGRSRSRSRTGGGNIPSSDASVTSMDSSIASVRDDLSATTDEGSLRVIAMQEDEINRLRKALEEKEFIYRQQLAEERASFKMQAVERERELQKKLASEKAKIHVPRFSPEKVMASASWDIWCFGLIMAESIIGRSELLPSSADTDDDFLIKLSEFNDIQLTAVFEEVRDYGGEFAADLIARLLHPKPEQRISTIDKVLQHKYFHAEIKEEKVLRLKSFLRK